MGYWDNSVDEQVKKLMAKKPNLTRRQAVSEITGGDICYKTNPVRAYCSGEGEIARRKRQIERGIIKITV